MINSYAYDVEILPNFFSITIIDVKDYLNIFKNACSISIKKGKEIRTPIPLIQKYSVKEIKDKLSKIKTYKFYITDTDDSQLLTMLGFFSDLRPHRDEKGIAIRNDLFGYNSSRYDKLMVAAFMMYANTTNTTGELIKKLYDTSKHIIEIQNNKELARHDYQLNLLNNFNLPYTDVDVMTIFALNKCGKGVDKDGNTIYFPKSLKQTSINLQWYELLEHELPPISDKDYKLYHKIDEYRGLYPNELNNLISKWDRYIIDEWIPDVMHYNLNDGFIVCEMIRLYLDEVKLRYNISNAYGVDVLSSSRSNISDVLFIKFYSDFSGLSPTVWRGKKTERTKMSFSKVIFPFIQFKTKELQDILEDMKKIIITSLGKDGLHNGIMNLYYQGKLISKLKSDAERIEAINKNKKNKIDKLKGIEIKLNNLIYTIATGGLHSQDIPRELVSHIIVNSDDESISVWDRMPDSCYIYRHFDITSFYPSIMVEYGIAPDHLNKGIFVKLVRWLRDTRIQAKHSDEDFIDGIPKDILAQALKIVINAIYGKLGYEFGELYDRLAVLKVTINGQLMIMMLCEELELNGIEVMSANTDGIVVKLHKSNLQKFEEITTNWKNLTRFGADSEDYLKYINRDINNYMAQELNHKITYKGDFNPLMYAVDLQKGYDMPIVAQAVSNYFIDGKPVLDTLYECTNILDFCKTQNVNRKFAVIYTKGGKSTIMQHNNRYYVSNNGGSIEKVLKADPVADCYIDSNGNITNITDNRGNLCAGQQVVVLNTLDDVDISFRDINYQYYYDCAFKLIDPIKLGISPNSKADPIKRTKSGKSNIAKYSGMYQSLFDDSE